MKVSAMRCDVCVGRARGDVGLLFAVSLDGTFSSLAVVFRGRREIFSRMGTIVSLISAGNRLACVAVFPVRARNRASNATSFSSWWAFDPLD
jgi:hypothetical protein